MILIKIYIHDLLYFTLVGTISPNEFKVPEVCSRISVLIFNVLTFPLYS